MRRLATVFALILTLQLAPPLAVASDDLPRAFAGCVMQGGEVRQVGGDVTCRVTHASDFRIYGTATNECGEEVQIEIWGESRIGVVTYFLAPGRTVHLPEVGMDGAWPRDPTIPCPAG